MPSVDRLLGHPGLAGAMERFGRPSVLQAARAVLDEVRATTVGGDPVPALDSIVDSVRTQAAAVAVPRPRRVVNATGVILHTNLGRAPVSEAAAEAMAVAMAGYSDLEYDLATGARGSRQSLTSGLVCQVTGAEDALVVNNNAGATLLVVTALARGKGVLVSRGELVEIGGGFRLPDVLEAGGARLIEVGTTNRTYAEDYRIALAGGSPGESGPPGAALILRVHASNYRLEGFTHRPTLDELVAIGAQFGVPVVDDLGSGSLLDTVRYGLGPEPLVQTSIGAGADLVTFSGDKLLGGPQAGVIAGRADWVALVKRHPLARALRPGKDVFAGVHATLRHYVRGDAEIEIPVWRMIVANEPELAARAAWWRAEVAGTGGYGDLAPGQEGADGLALLAGRSTIGGGSLPGETLPTTLLSVATADADGFVMRLRLGDPPVVARIEGGSVLLDPRTVLPGQDEAVVLALRRALEG